MTVSKCGVRILEDHKACFGDNVYWYNDCDQPFVIDELCTCGCIDSACKPLEECPTFAGINVQIHSDADRCEAEDAIFFWVTATGGNSDTYIYEWDFGYGASSALSEVTQWFPIEGLFPVVAVVSDDNGQKGSAGKIIQVGNKPPYLIITEPSENTEHWDDEPLTAVCDVHDLEDGILSTSDIVWSNGQTGTNSVFTGLAPGLQTISVTATDSEGESTTASVPVIIKERDDENNISCSQRSECQDGYFCYLGFCKKESEWLAGSSRFVGYWHVVKEYPDGFTFMMDVEIFSTGRLYYQPYSGMVELTDGSYGSWRYDLSNGKFEVILDDGDVVISGPPHWENENDFWVPGDWFLRTYPGDFAWLRQDVEE